MRKPSVHRRLQQAWNKYTPDVQLTGYLVMLGTIVLSALYLIDAARASVTIVETYNTRLTTVEQAIGDIRNDGKNHKEQLDLVIRLLTTKQRNN